MHSCPLNKGLEMTSDFKNEFGQPVGRPAENWTKRPLPPRSDMIGNHVIVSPLDITRNAKQLFEANREAMDGSRFTYLFTDAFDGFDAYRSWLETMAKNDDPMFHTIIDKASQKAVGVAAFMRIDVAFGGIEIGNINYSPALSQTIGGTEAMYLMMKRAFDELGYRRYEWKCDDQNAPSRAAAARYGFTYEGKVSVNNNTTPPRHQEHPGNPPDFRGECLTKNRGPQ